MFRYGIGKRQAALLMQLVWTVFLLPRLFADEYEIGGPLAGLKLPASKQNTGPGPELELYPGSVEHYRAYFMKYLPVRSFFDQQSMLKNWVAPTIPGASASKVEQYDSPIYSQPKNGRATDTGKKLPAVPVVRCGIEKPVFKLDLGTLDVGLYAVRVIGAVETAKLRDFREPLFIAMRVNDGLKSEISTYRVRIGYVDEFYSVAEIYFHATEKRHFQAELFVDKGSTVELLVHNITLDDVMAGTIKRPIKKRMTLTTAEAIAELKASFNDEQKKQIASIKRLSSEERVARDEAIWEWLPPLNAQGLYMHAPLPTGASVGVADKTAEQIEAQYGTWEWVNTLDHNRGGVLLYDPDSYRAFLENKKLGLKYSIDDLIARKPLPDPFPYKDDGTGLYFPDSKDPTRGRLFAPIAQCVHARLRPSPNMSGGAKSWIQSGNRDLARDAAVDLIRYAYDLPAIDDRNFLNNVMCIPGGWSGRDNCCRQRSAEAQWRSHYQNYLLALDTYEELFDYIKGNNELAQSVHRFVPWVKTWDDVIQLLDAYLVQTTAKRILRYHDHTLPMATSTIAAALGDNSVTDPWMEWLFARTFVYPLEPAGVQDLMIVGHDREGPQYLGSTYYSQGEGARRMAAELDPYLRAGGNPKYNLANISLYPKPLAHCYWQLNTIIGGADFARIGDVCGPDKSPFATAGENLAEASRFGWRWSADPSFAWMLKNVFGCKDETDEERKKIDSAAATVKRAPWLDNRSRVVNNWFGVLETGLQHDDYRFRRAVYVRAGSGYGHEHADTLDLQLVAHGLPMTIDGGQRSGYSKPNDKFSRIHNTVEVDAAGNSEYGLGSDAYIQMLSDAEGARYLVANAIPPAGASLFKRQVALIDVDEGKGSQPLPTPLQKPKAVLPKDVSTANSYVFDVFRISGGKLHTYCFHGPISDDFQWNAANVKPVEHLAEANGAESETKYLGIFTASPENKQAGDVSGTFQATWRYSRDDKTGSEQKMLGSNFNPESPRKFTRLALFDVAGLRALKADVVTTPNSPVQYRFTDVMLQKRGDKLESAFAAIIEPYAGEGFIASQKAIPIEGNDTDARRAVAVEVKTKNGGTDICFADGRPYQIRQLPITNHQLRISAEFAFYSTDSNGLRHAMITGGTLLQAPELNLGIAEREHIATITKVDYLKKTFWIDGPWPAACGGRVIEITPPGCPTSYTAASVTLEGQGSRIVVTRGADFYRAGVTRVVSDQNEVDGKLSLPVGHNHVQGMTVSNDQMTKFWRVAGAKGNDFTVTGSIADADFAPSNAMRLWEYGVGDTVRQSTFASVRRIEPRVFEVRADVDLVVAFKGKHAEFSTGGKSWKRLSTKQSQDWVEFKMQTAQLAGGAVLVKVEK